MNLGQLESAVTEGVRIVYAIGDVHGRLDLAVQIEEAIAADIAERSVQCPLICHLGDYIDRGPSSAGVLDYLSSLDSRERRVFLKGNHEDRLLQFLEDPQTHGAPWMKFGGVEALRSYGCDCSSLVAPNDIDAEGWIDIRNRFLAALPASHLDFLRSLKLALRWDGFLFVHAGLDPNKSLDEQTEHDLMWIREPFLSSDLNWGFRVVHGHVVVDTPEFRSNRISIDTGAVKSGRLTCLVAEKGGSTRIIQTRE